MNKQHDEDAPSANVPKLIVFDLDGTVWWPEMYMLPGGPFRADPKTGNVFCGKPNNPTPVYLLEQTRPIMQLLMHDPQFAHSELAISSCTDEPSWAQECLRLMEVEPGVSVKSRFRYEQISKTSKRNHFIALQKQTGLAFKEMIFFDNERGRVNEVRPLGVTAVYCPDGLTMDVWNKGIAEWKNNQEL
ncbi:magnesium-dependent phosphatase-1 [Obelidium mucronatum]|nr:magnesium-dependent phosphatase-1 [Obelidium mucronatum]